MIRTTLALSLALPLVLAPVTAQGDDAQKHELAMSARPGNSVWLRQTTKTVQEIDMGIQQAENKSTVDITASFNVTAVADDGKTTVDVKIERVRGSFGVPNMGEFPFDSLDGDQGEQGGDDGGFGGFGMPDFGAVGKAAASMAGTAFAAVLDRKGKVTAVTGLEEALKKAEEEAGQMGRQMLSGTFSETAISNFVESAFGTRPQQATPVGGTWKPEADDDDGPQTKMTLKLARVTDKAFEVTGEGTVEKPKLDGGDDGDDSPEAAMQRELMKSMEIKNGKVSFRSLVSREDGFLVESTRNLSMDMTMESPMGAIEMTNSTTVTTKRTSQGAAMAKKPAGDPAKQGGDK